MTNPHLLDSVERVARDPRRKLGWDDRLVGTMRLALQQGVVPHRYALGTAAALARLEPSFLETDLTTRDVLAPLWGNETMNFHEAPQVLQFIDEAKPQLKRWRDSGFQAIGAFGKRVASPSGSSPDSTLMTAVRNPYQPRFHSETLPPNLWIVRHHQYSWGVAAMKTLWRSVPKG